MAASTPRPRAGTRSRLAATVERRIPFWEPQMLVLAALIIDVALPGRLTPFGPPWLLPALEGALLIGLVAAGAHPRGRHSPSRRRVAVGLTAVVSATNIVSLIRLCHLLLQPAHGHPISNGHELIISGFALWATNVLLFALWYYQIDRGGPVARRFGEPNRVDFMFPQMGEGRRWSAEDWSPGLVDYLYLSFTNATAFSPTDTMPLTPMAKVLMAGQSLAALVTVGLVIARAVNILG